MPQREGKCTNFGLCTMADRREAITLPDGEDFSRPECGKTLTEIEGKGKSGGSGGSKGLGKSKLALAGLRSYCWVAGSIVLSARAAE
jgi:phosphate transport system substrate-binding protein